MADCDLSSPTGPARPLDFGHWAAHKLEQLSEYKIRRGEAVGLALDVVYPGNIGLLDGASAERVLRCWNGRASNCLRMN